MAWFNGTGAGEGITGMITGINVFGQGGEIVLMFLCIILACTISKKTSSRALLTSALYATLLALHAVTWVWPVLIAALIGIIWGIQGD